MSGEKQDFFDNPNNIRNMLRVFYVICALLFAADFVVHRHTEFRFEGLPGFYPIYGFVGCVILVFAAKWMRTFLMRPEDYYDKRELTDFNSDDGDTSSHEDTNTSVSGGHQRV
ncbi:hypothetical protein [Microbulbifer agarilyticus]